MKVQGYNLLKTLIWTLFWVQPVLAKNLAWDELKVGPDSAKIAIQVREGEGFYHVMTQEGPLELKLEGPSQLLVHIRPSFLDNEADLKEYKINVMMDNRTFDEYRFHARRSKIAKMVENSADTGVGRLRKFVVEVPEGKHFFKFFSSDELPQQKIFLRFYLSEKITKAEKRISMSPEQYQDVVTLVYKEKEQSYYRMSETKPVRIIVDGPTELKVVTRLEFNRRMKGKYTYQVQILEDDKLIQTRQYRTYKSDIVSYKNVSSFSPGRARSFLVWVPKGQHTYKLVPITMSHETVLVKILIPKKDITVIQE